MLAKAFRVDSICINIIAKAVRVDSICIKLLAKVFGVDSICIKMIAKLFIYPLPLYTSPSPHILLGEKAFWALRDSTFENAYVLKRPLSKQLQRKNGGAC